MYKGAMLAEVDFDDFVICQLGYVKVYFPEFPFPLCFWLGWHTRHFFMGTGGQKWSRSHFVFYTQMVRQVLSYLIHCCLSAGSSYWGGIVARPAAAPSSPESSFNFSDSWAKCVFRPLIKNVSFCWTPTTRGLEAPRIHMHFSVSSWFLAHAHGSSLFLLSLSLHSSSVFGFLTCRFLAPMSDKNQNQKPKDLLEIV